MTDLCLAFDPSSSVSKAIYTLKPFKVEWLFMEPEAIEVPDVGIEQYEANRIGEAEPENQAWIEVKGKYYAVGLLARNRFYGDAALKELKYERAVYKVLAMVGAIAAKKKLSTTFSLSLGILLPYGEYQDRERFKSLIASALENFSFRGQCYRVILENFNCLPEGAGILLRGLEASVNLKQTNVLVIMVGYRNASFLLWEKGQLSRGETTELGFVRLLERVKESTSGLTLTELLVPVTEAGSQIETSQLRSLVKSSNVEGQQTELRQVVEAIAMARPQIWASLSNWLQSRKFPTIDHVAIAGGTSYYYRQELKSLWTRARIHWGKNLEKQIIKMLGKSCYQVGWRYRLTDVYGYFFFLQYLFDSQCQSASREKVVKV
jgi:hypothetical protein